MIKLTVVQVPNYGHKNTAIKITDIHMVQLNGQTMLQYVDLSDEKRTPKKELIKPVICYKDDDGW